MTCEDLEMAFAVADMGLSCLVEREKTETEKKPCAAHPEAVSDKGVRSCDNDCDDFDDDVSFDLRLRSELNKRAIGVDTRHRCPGYLVRLIDRMPEKKSEMLADLLGPQFVALRHMVGHETFLVLLDFLQGDRVAFPSKAQVMRRQHLIDVFAMSRNHTLLDTAHRMGTSFAQIQKCLELVQAERDLYMQLNPPESRDDWIFDDDDDYVN